MTPTPPILGELATRRKSLGRRCWDKSLKVKWWDVQTHAKFWRNIWEQRGPLVSAPPRISVMLPPSLQTCLNEWITCHQHVVHIQLELLESESGSLFCIRHPPTLGSNTSGAEKLSLCGRCWRCTPRRVSSPSLVSILALNGFPPRERCSEKGLNSQKLQTRRLFTHLPVLGSLLPTPRKSFRPLIPTLPHLNNLQVLFPRQPEALL